MEEIKPSGKALDLQNAKCKLQFLHTACKCISLQLRALYLHFMTYLHVSVSKWYIFVVKLSHFGSNECCTDFQISEGTIEQNQGGTACKVSGYLRFLSLQE